MYLVFVVLAGLLSAALCVYAFVKLKDAPGARYYMLTTSLSAFFTFSYAFELISVDLEHMIFWLRLEYLAIPFIPVCILLMCIDYAGQKIKPWMFYLLFVLPIITIFMHLTNSSHHLYYKSVTINQDAPFPILQLEGGPWFFVHSAFLFVCIMLSVITLLAQLKNSTFHFKMQIFTMVAGLLIPIVANYFYINMLNPHGVDLGPVSMSLSFILHGIALVSFQMFNVAPIARDTIFGSLNEGIIVLNQKKIIVDFNEAVRKIIPILSSDAIGTSISTALSGNKKLLEIILNSQESDYELEVNNQVVYYHIRFSSVKNKTGKQIGQIITFVDITERVILQEKLKQLASLDSLTQLYNRTFFNEKVEEVLETLAVEGGSMAMVMFDIDFFKKVNDTWGHEAGDAILTHVANVAKGNLRYYDIIGRFGGEEFIICLPDTSVTTAYQIAEKIRTMVETSSILINGEEVSVTSSFGVTHCQRLTANHREVIRNLTNEADQALYASKRRGRNCVHMYLDTIQTAK